MLWALAAKWAQTPPADTPDWLVERFTAWHHRDVHQGQQLSWARRGGRLAAVCPFHDDRTPSLLIDPPSNRWRCFTCEALATDEAGRGWKDTIDFIRELFQVDFVGARDRLIDLVDHGGATSAVADRSPPDTARSPARADALAEVLDDLTRHAPRPSASLHAWAKRRGFGDLDLDPDVITLHWPGSWRWLERRHPPPTLTAAGILTDSGKPLWYRRDALIIYRDPAGRPVYGQAFSTDPATGDRSHVKYCGPRGIAAPWPFGANHANGGTHLHVCEGAVDALTARLLQGVDAIGIPGAASSVPAAWIDILKGYATLVLAHDADPAGDALAKKFVASLRSHGWQWRWVRLRQTADGTDLCDSLAVYDTADET